MGDLSKMFKGACIDSFNTASKPDDSFRFYSVDLSAKQNSQPQRTIMECAGYQKSAAQTVSSGQNAVQAGAGSHAQSVNVQQSCAVNVDAAKQGMSICEMFADNIMRQISKFTQACGLTHHAPYVAAANVGSDATNAALGQGFSCIAAADLASQVMTNSNVCSEADADAMMCEMIRANAPSTDQCGPGTGQADLCAILDEGYSIAEIIRTCCDLENNCPEYKELSTQCKIEEQKLANAQAIKAKTERDLTIDVDNTCASLSSISSCVLENVALFVDEIKDFITPKDATPELLAKRNAPAAPGGMNA